MNEPKYDEFVGVITAAIKDRVTASPHTLSIKGNAEADIRRFYELCRRQMKDRMAHDNPPSPWNAQRLDRHKIAAAVCWAITRAQPIDTTKAKTANDRLATEMVAFAAPLQVLLSFAADDAIKAAKPTLATYFQHGPALPTTTDKIAFTVHVARCLYWQTRKNAAAEPHIDKWIDAFQLAIMYYMIEVFTSLEGQYRVEA